MNIKQRLELAAQDPRKTPELQRLLIEASMWIECFEKDAARYRYLRDTHIGNDPAAINLAPGKRSGLNAAIDAAIAQQDKKE